MIGVRCCPSYQDLRAEASNASRCIAGKEGQRDMARIRIAHRSQRPRGDTVHAVGTQKRNEHIVRPCARGSSKFLLSVGRVQPLLRLLSILTPPPRRRAETTRLVGPPRRAVHEPPLCRRCPQPPSPPTFLPRPSIHPPVPHCLFSDGTQLACTTPTTAVFSAGSGGNVPTLDRGKEATRLFSKAGRGASAKSSDRIRFPDPGVSRSPSSRSSLERFLCLDGDNGIFPLGVGVASADAGKG
ncbi:hypothetical protein BV20DRAFT_699758 [Pilatotrama ljubarskyi]|nr:hypothetical protein BV20DRAFT_699758 [Pilatotrama ljubarskyi]